MRRKLKKSREEGDADADADDSSPVLSRLPDEIILEILNKLMDLKSLCCCYLVSRRFSSIVLRVDTITFTAPLLIPPVGYIDDQGGILRNLFSILIYAPFLLKVLHSKRDESFPFLSAITFLSKFRGVKSLSIELPSSSHIATDNCSLFKWKVNFGNRIESFYFLSPDSVSETDAFHANGNGGEQQPEDIDMGIDNIFFKQNLKNSILCLTDANAWHMMLLYYVKKLQKLEKISITDSGRSGRLSLSGRKLREVKEWVHSVSDITKINPLDHPYIMRNSYIPALKLPVSGYAMKGVYFLVMEKKGIQQGEYDNTNDGFEGKEETTYTEAVMGILKKHKGRTEGIEVVVWYRESGSD